MRPTSSRRPWSAPAHAEKKQIQVMIGFLLPKARFESADEADALAIAICHASHRSSPQAIAARRAKEAVL